MHFAIIILCLLSATCGAIHVHCTNIGLKLGGKFCLGVRRNSNKVLIPTQCLFPEENQNKYADYCEAKLLHKSVARTDHYDIERISSYKKYYSFNYEISGEITWINIDDQKFSDPSMLDYSFKFKINSNCLVFSGNNGLDNKITEVGYMQITEMNKCNEAFKQQFDPEIYLCAQCVHDNCDMSKALGSPLYCDNVTPRRSFNGLAIHIKKNLIVFYEKVKYKGSNIKKHVSTTTMADLNKELQ